MANPEALAKGMSTHSNPTPITCADLAPTGAIRCPIVRTSDNGRLLFQLLDYDEPFPDATRLAWIDSLSPQERYRKWQAYLGQPPTKTSPRAISVRS